jgi:hypothetical protein
VIEEEKDTEQSDDGSSEAAAEGAGNPTVDEPTETSLEPHNDEGFRDGVPEPGR